MMKIAFAEQDELYIKRQVESGFYSNATELVRDAVRRLRESDQRTRLLAALELGEKAIEEGRTTPYTPEFMAESKERAKKRAGNGEKAVRPDVVPC